MSTHNIHLKYRTPKRYPTIISIVPPGVALIVTFELQLSQTNSHAPKGFKPSKFDYFDKHVSIFSTIGITAPYVWFILGTSAKIPVLINLYKTHPNHYAAFYLRVLHLGLQFWGL